LGVRDTMSDVQAAQNGDSAAFRRLVDRYQNMVRAYAAGWVGDAADDVAQEVFVNAFLKLGQLDDPAKFGGWLRRIAHKHCDRRTRRPRREALVEVEEIAPPVEPADGAWLLDAIERLPAHERIVVALHYLGDEPQKDVADFLGLPLTTVKKRLHTARGRLAKRRTPMQVTTTTQLEDRVALFVALRQSDRDAVRAILTQHPALVEAAEHYSDEEAFAAGLPLAHRLTPLILAAGRGDDAMVRLLLELGADPDTTCGCDAEETALFAAALRGRATVVERLLAAGADPKRTNHVGFTPVDVARMRRHHDVLLCFGATPDDAEPDAAATPEQRIVTGIRALDLLAPLERGTIVRVHGAAETGLTVLLAELAARFAAMGGHSVWTSGGAGTWQGPSLADVVVDLGIERHTTAVATGALEVVQSMQDARDPVALFVFLGDAPEAEVEAALAAFRRTATITFVIDPWVAVTKGAQDAPALAAPYDAVIHTSRALAEAGVYPALDAVGTDSTAQVTPRHAQIREAVRARRDDPSVARHFAQWFSVAETDTGHPGEVFGLDETLDGFAGVVARELG
jgi:RNA polymerase sigma factor (sigma-70 family)